MKTYIAVCNQCGAAAIVPTEHAEETIATYADEPDEEAVIVSRCGIQYNTDSGDDYCSGDFIITGTIEVSPLVRPASGPPTENDAHG